MTTMRILIRAAMMAMLFGLALSPASLAQDATPPADGDLPACAQGPAEEAELADFQTAELTNARTGETFTIGDFSGCTIFVETMATWCMNCMMQLSNVSEAAPQLDPDKHVFIAISVETELSNETLAEYADNNGFDWLFSVTSNDMLKAIVDEFGRGAIVPPSTPHIIVSPDGTVGELITGIHSSDEIVNLMNEAGETDAG